MKRLFLDEILESAQLLDVIEALFGEPLSPEEAVRFCPHCQSGCSRCRSGFCNEHLCSHYRSLGRAQGARSNSWPQAEI